MNTLLRTLFLFVRKLLIKTLNCLCHLLTFSHYLLIFNQMKQLTFVLIWLTINVKKVKVCSSVISNNFYRRFVDDVFLIFERKDQVKKFLRYMNSRHPNIQFTCKEESSNKVSFLDVSITRMNNKLVRLLYRKKIFSGVYVNYNSFLPLKYKKGLVYTLILRAFNICANYNTLHNEVQYLKSIWQKKLFPIFFNDSCIRRFLDKLFITRRTSDSVSGEKEIFIGLEF